METVEEAVEFVKNFVDKGGPESGERTFFLKKINEIANKVRNHEFSYGQKEIICEAFGEALSLKTLQGFIYLKPHGYNGDYEVMERVYNRYVCEVQSLSNWDELWQVQNASNAVRYRIQYIRYLINEARDLHKGTLRILNVASGSGRDILEFFERHPDADVEIDCMDIDTQAIEFAKGLLHKYLDRINFYNTSSFRFRTEKKYHLIWSAGLLDYFNNKNFLHTLNQFLNLTVDNGKVCIGNFSRSNAMIDFMDILDWKLYYREEDELKKLIDTLAENHNIEYRIALEPEKVNYFVHIRKK